MSGHKKCESVNTSVNNTNIRHLIFLLQLTITVSGSATPTEQNVRTLKFISVQHIIDWNSKNTATGVLHTTVVTGGVDQILSPFWWSWMRFTKKKVSVWRKRVPQLSAFRIKLKEKEHSDRVYSREGIKVPSTKSLSSIIKVPKVATPFKDDCSPLLKWIIREKR